MLVLLTKIDRYWFVFMWVKSFQLNCNWYILTKKLCYCASFTWEVLIRSKYRSYYLVFRIAVTKAAPHFVRVGIFSYSSSCSRYLIHVSTNRVISRTYVLLNRGRDAHFVEFITYLITDSGTDINLYFYADS